MAALAVAVSPPPTVKGSSLNTPLKARRQRNCFQKKKGGQMLGMTCLGGKVAQKVLDKRVVQKHIFGIGQILRV